MKIRIPKSEIRNGNADPVRVWIIGYGNPHRRDDGVGPHVVNGLGRFLGPRRGCRLLSLLQLNPDLAEDMRDAHSIVLVDASAEYIEGGWSWTRVLPEWGDLPYLTHHTSPPFFLGLLQAVYHACPAMWLVSVQGEDFGFGEGLCPETEKRAKAVIWDIARWMSQEKLTRRNQIENDIQRGISNGSWRRHTRGG